jgi:hypothetical protein
MLLNSIAKLHLILNAFFCPKKLVHLYVLCTPVMSKKYAKGIFTSQQTPQPLNGIVAIVNCSKPLLSLVTLFMDTSVEYSWAQIAMKSVMSELSLGVIDFALSVFALVSTCVSSSGHCIDTILFSHIALGILCLFSKNVKLEGAIWTKGWGELVQENVGWIPVCSCHDIESR